jgi:hypothetical protein
MAEAAFACDLRLMVSGASNLFIECDSAEVLTQLDAHAAFLSACDRPAEAGGITRAALSDIARRLCLNPSTADFESRPLTAKTGVRVPKGAPMISMS